MQGLCVVDFLIVLPSYRSASKLHERFIRELVRATGAGVVEPDAGSPNICHARCLLADTAYQAPESVHLWIDDDTIAKVDDALSLVEQCAAGKRIVGADYAAKESGTGRLTAGFGSGKRSYFAAGSTMPVKWLGFGMVAVHRTVLTAMIKELAPVRVRGRSVHPYFISAPDPKYGDYPSSDVWFCRRAAELGIQSWCDTRIRIMHEGPYSYGIEDAMMSLSRPDKLTLESEDP